MAQLVELALMLPLQIIDNTQSQKIKRALEDSIGASLSEKVLREMVNAAARNENIIKRPRLSSLNLLSKFVLGSYQPDNAVREALDRENYWYKYLEINKHLIPLKSLTTTVINREAGGHNDDTAGNASVTKDYAVQEDRRNESKKTDTGKDRSYEQKNFNRKNLEGALVGGFLVGIVNSLLIIFFPGLLSGYFVLDKSSLLKLIPLISAINITGGILFGLFCGIYGNPARLHSANQIISTKEKLLTIIISFFVFDILKQVASRGHNLGHPDFETISHYLAFVTGLIALLKILRTQPFLTMSHRVKLAMLVTLKTAVPMILVYLFFRFVITSSAWYDKIYPREGFVLFHFNYPHPERIILVLTIVFCSAFIFLSTRDFYLKAEKL